MRHASLSSPPDGHEQHVQRTADEPERVGGAQIVDTAQGCVRRNLFVMYRFVCVFCFCHGIIVPHVLPLAFRATIEGAEAMRDGGVLFGAGGSGKTKLRRKKTAPIAPSDSAAGALPSEEIGAQEGAEENDDWTEEDEKAGVEVTVDALLDEPAPPAGAGPRQQKGKLMRRANDDGAPLALGRSKKGAVLPLAGDLKDATNISGNPPRIFSCKASFTLFPPS